MSTKVTIKVAAGASHAVRATRVATPTGQEYETKEVGADGEETFELGDEERIDITQGGKIEDAAPEEDAGRKKK